ncbi:DUF3054 domain-containing protein [Halomarina ordinaria]|uniref:DUF3054 domain-containing protein n=1 Tax=Halomarina ordinaria TaxID=3033939 RepID=A0ABD5U6Z9_9EURY|nr:DUF3054 domain-containing protein [Halomarina sp. PSRA2]
MSTRTATSRGRIDLSRTTLALAAGDLLLIAAFVVLGEFSHIGVERTFANPGYVFEAFLPFLLGWLVVAPLVGAYGREARETVRSAVGYALFAWGGAVVVGQALRATPLFRGDFAVTFFLVSLGVGAVLLVPWRVVVSVLD